MSILYNAERLANLQALRRAIHQKPPKKKKRKRYERKKQKPKNPFASRKMTAYSEFYRRHKGKRTALDLRCRGCHRADPIYDICTLGVAAKYQWGVKGNCLAYKKGGGS
jgi:hypothetical protein